MSWLALSVALVGLPASEGSVLGTPRLTLDAIALTPDASVVAPRLPLGLLPHLAPAHSPEAGMWAWVVGALVGVGTGIGVGYAVGKNSTPGKGVAAGLGVGALSAVLTTVVMYVILEG